MNTPRTYFQPETRHIVIVENASDMQTAEQEADKFLDAESAADEGGSCYVRASASGIQRDNGFYFKVVMTAGKP